MRTRASAYALAIHDGHILLAQLAQHCSRPGYWTLPGGGIDHGEQPMEAVVREAMEETGLVASELQLLHARTFSEKHPHEDYLAVQLIYVAHMRGKPEVQEVGGSTAHAEWVALEDLEGAHQGFHGAGGFGFLRRAK